CHICLLCFVSAPCPSLISSLSYTTLFRSLRPELLDQSAQFGIERRAVGGRRRHVGIEAEFEVIGPQLPAPARLAIRIEGGRRVRSEEHTSELQSRENLVCRLLLEKKKKTR